MKKKVLIVCANYYSDISNGLLSNAKKKLRQPFDLILVPGVFEIPVTISKNIKKYDGFIALGCVIKGETPHFDFISRSSINGIMHLSFTYRKPIANGIITCLNKKQALARSSKSNNKGAESAKALISLLKI